MKIRIVSLFIAAFFTDVHWVHAATPLGCLIEPDQIANVGSQVIGVTEAIMVERGDYVRKGQVLATLKSDIERANVGVAKTRSQLEADVRTAEANLNLAKVTEKRGQELVEKKFLSQQALDKSHAETLVAQQRLAFAKEQLQLASGELNVARAQLGMRAIRSPIDGIVSERFVWPGERVEEKPLFKIVKIHPLRVEVIAPVTLFGQIQTDEIITIQPDLPNAQPIDAKVVLVDKLIDGASNTFRVRAEIPNQDMKIPSGVRCKATIPETFKSAAYNAPDVQMPAVMSDTRQQPTSPARVATPNTQASVRALPAKPAKSASPLVNAKHHRQASDYAEQRPQFAPVAKLPPVLFGNSQVLASKPATADKPFMQVDSSVKGKHSKQVAAGKIRFAVKPPQVTAANTSPVEVDTDQAGLQSGLILDKSLSNKDGKQASAHHYPASSQASKFY